MHSTFTKVFSFGVRPPVKALIFGLVIAASMGWFAWSNQVQNPRLIVIVPIVEGAPPLMGPPFPVILAVLGGSWLIYGVALFIPSILFVHLLSGSVSEKKLLAAKGALGAARFLYFSTLALIVGLVLAYAITQALWL